MNIPGRLLWWAFRAPIKAMVQAPIKGAMGEFAVKVGAALSLPSLVYRRYHNVTLPTVDGTTQIDHVFVSVFGVFVVETKNMGGWIFGSERNRQWTEVFPTGQKYKLQNPLRQNYRHVRAIEDSLVGIGLPKGAVKSVVVFVGDVDLKTEMPEDVTVGFGKAGGYIRSFKTRLLSEGAGSGNLYSDREWTAETVVGDKSTTCAELEAAQGRVGTSAVSKMRKNDGIADGETRNSDGDTVLGV